MGRSQTINVIGFSMEHKIDEDTYRRYECHAMNKMEMAQKKKGMAKRGTPIISWFAQTNAGCRMIGADFIWDEIPDCKIKHVKLIKCPICKGIGKKRQGNTEIYTWCVVCDGSGLTRNNHWNKWQDWQVESFKLKFA